MKQFADFNKNGILNYPEFTRSREIKKTEIPLICGKYVLNSLLFLCAKVYKAPSVN